MALEPVQHIKRVFRDCSTTSNGPPPPAPPPPPASPTLGCLVFLALVVYDTLQKKSFDAIGFATGLAGVSSTLAAAAAGVRIKDSTEIKPDPATQPDGSGETAAATSN